MGQEKPSKAKLALAALGAVFCVLGLVLGARALFAESKSGPSELTLNPENQEQIVCERRARELQTQLDLSEEQVAQVSEIIRDLRAQGLAMRQDNAGNMQNLMGLRMEMMRQLDEKMKGVLNEEQLALYAEKKDNMQERFGKIRALRQQFLGGNQ